MTSFYWLKRGTSDWQHVTKQAWIQAERAAGFRPKLSSDHPDYMNVCATAGFSGGYFNAPETNCRGSITSTPEFPNY